MRVRLWLRRRCWERWLWPRRGCRRAGRRGSIRRWRCGKSRLAGESAFPTTALFGFAERVEGFIEAIEKGLQVRELGLFRADLRFRVGLRAAALPLFGY